MEVSLSSASEHPISANPQALAPSASSSLPDISMVPIPSPTKEKLQDEVTGLEAALRHAQADAAQRVFYVMDQQRSGFEEAARRYEREARDVTQVELARSTAELTRDFQTSLNQNRLELALAEASFQMQQNALEGEACHVVEVEKAKVVSEAEQALAEKQLQYQNAYSQMVKSAEGDLQLQQDQVRYLSGELASVQYQQRVQADQSQAVAMTLQQQLLQAQRQSDQAQTTASERKNLVSQLEDKLTGLQQDKAGLLQISEDLRREKADQERKFQMQIDQLEEQMGQLQQMYNDRVNPSDDQSEQFAIGTHPPGEIVLKLVRTTPTNCRQKVNLTSRW